jgi:phage anti-repressor protein
MRSQKMASKLTEDIVFSLIRSEEDFPVDFDEAWHWIGWGKKQDAKQVLNYNFEEGVDFLRLGVKSSTGGRPSEWIVLSIDCFKSLAMMAGTKKGKEVRRYFLDCEKKLKLLLKAQKEKWEKDTQERLVAAMVSEETISRYPKFDDEFYELLYQKRGGGWENRSPKKRPSCVAQWTNETVYDRLLGGVEPGGVKDKLNQVNPIINGRRKHRQHWHLRELGEYHLKSHLEAVKALARVSPDGDWDKFMYNVAKGLPNGQPLQLSLLDMLEQTNQNKNF